MALNFADRMLTVIVTATLTSAVWIVAGGSLIENASDAAAEDSVRPAIAAPSPLASGQTVPANLAQPSAAPAAPLDTGGASNPEASMTANLMVPVLNVRPSELTDTFADSREDGSRLHEAIDIRAPAGTSVVAAAAGTIEKIFNSGVSGKTLYVRSPDRLTIHYYAHMDEYAPGLKEGQRVRRGQRLGTVGSTGNASSEAPHLHFSILRTTEDAEWWEPANAINPYPLLIRR